MEQLSPILEIKSVPLEPTTIRHHSGKNRTLKLKNDSEPDRYLNNQSKASVNPSVNAAATNATKFHANDHLRNESPTVGTCRLAIIPSQAAFPGDFPDLGTVRRKLSLILPHSYCTVAAILAVTQNHYCSSCRQ